MTLQVFAGISLRSEQDVHFGTLVRISTGMVGVLTDGVYRVGDELEFQLDLAGFDSTVQGVVQVERADLQPEKLNRYLLRIRRMRRDDQALLQEWYDQQQAGLEPSLLTGAEPGQALDSQVESRLPSNVGVDMPGPPPAHDSRGRAALRALLLDAANRPPPEVDQLGGAAGDSPDITLETGTSPASLEVRYRTEGAWRREGRGLLGHGLLFLPLPPPHPELDTPLDVHILCPPRVDLRMNGRVALLHDRGIGISLSGAFTMPGSSPSTPDEPPKPPSA